MSSVGLPAGSATALRALWERLGDLKQLPRTGWLLAGVVQPESIAEHSFAAAVLALFLAESINADPESQGLTHPLNVDRVVRLALLHDLAESLVTDLPKRSAQLLGTNAKQQAEERAMEAILAHVAGGGHALTLWREYDQAATPEARLVKDVDKLEMVLQARRYRTRGHGALDEFWQGHRWHYPLSAAVYADVIANQE